MDIFGIKQLKKQVSDLAAELHQKNDLISQQKQTIEELRSSLFENVQNACELQNALELLKKDYSTYSPIYKFEQPSIELNFDSLQEIWAKWPIDLHNEPAQIARQERATAPLYTPLSLSPEKGTATFKGNLGNYNTNLSHCECMDFQRRLRPCKHIYRLAYELDVFMLDNVESVSNPQQLLTLVDVKKLVKTFSPSQIELFRTIVSNDGEIVELSSNSANITLLTKLHLVEQGSDPYQLLSSFKKDVLYSFIPENPRVKVPKSLKKDALIETIIQNFPAILNDINKFYMFVVPNPVFSSYKDDLINFLYSF